MHHQKKSQMYTCRKTSLIIWRSTKPTHTANIISRTMKYQRSGKKLILEGKSKKNKKQNRLSRWQMPRTTDKLRNNRKLINTCKSKDSQTRHNKIQENSNRDVLDLVEVTKDQARDQGRKWSHHLCVKRLQNSRTSIEWLHQWDPQLLWHLIWLEVAKIPSTKSSQHEHHSNRWLLKILETSASMQSIVLVSSQTSLMIRIHRPR